MGNRIGLTAGIRQGCPLSPLLFVVVLDGLLRRLRADSPRTFTRMYADDTAMVLEDIVKELPVLDLIFQEIGRAANLHLNVRKCILIPLFGADEGDPQLLLRTAAPALAGMTFAGCGKYLGYWIGPDKGHRSWQQAFKKAGE